MTLLEYVAQLHEVTGRVQDAETSALRKLASGPGTWVITEDLENLTRLGFKADFRRIGLTARAAKMRICMTVAKDTTKKTKNLSRIRRRICVGHWGTGITGAIMVSCRITYGA